MKFQFNDGGRAEAGYKGSAGDCVTRAIAIATEAPYQVVYDAINQLAKQGKGRKSSARSGVHKDLYQQYLISIGWEWVSTMGIGTGCKVHLSEDELPTGRLIVKVSKHLTAVIEGVIHDTFDPSRGGCRCVYGYWRRC